MTSFPPAAPPGPVGAIDSVTVDLIGSQLCAVAEEMGTVLVRAAYSTNIKERRDCSAALLMADGTTLAQAEHIPLHLGSMLELVPAIQHSFGDDMAPGDVFVVNDPYGGGSTHLPDISIAAPVFDERGLSGWAVTVAHHSEVGGVRAAAKDIYDEGLRLTPLRIMAAGRLEQPVLDLILANCRVPAERLGDLRAQLAAVRLGERRTAELVAKYGAGTVRAAAAGWLGKAERQARGALAQLPTGTFSFVDYMDDDGAGATDLQIAARVDIAADRITIDFAGSHAQVQGAINVVRPALLATVYYTVKLVLDPTLPANGGYYGLVEVHAPEASLVNAAPPAPVLSRSDTCQRIVDVLLGAFAQAVPERVSAACNGAITGIEFSGNHPQQGPFSYIETLGGGFGARPGSDGPDGVQAHMTNTSNLSVEALEIEYPLRVRRYELREGSGGPGRHRGGLGLVREVEVMAERAYFRAKGDRTVRGPWGLEGGAAGAPARFTLNPGTGRERALGSKDIGIVLERGDVVRVATAGGGGHGSPGERSAGSHERDLAEGKVAS
jgi:N-methylhydantoinase B